MNLVTRFLAAQRDKLLMKLGCWLVCFSLVLGLMLPQQKAEALVAELSIAAVASVAASYLCACGLPLVTQGMDRDTLVSSVQRLIQEFLDTELGGITIQDWLGNVWDLAVIAGKLVMGRPLTEEFAGFAQWVAGKYAVQAGEYVVYSNRAITFEDGSVYMLSYFVDENAFLASEVGSYMSQDFVLGTPIPITLGTSETNCFEVNYYPGFSLKAYVFSDEDSPRSLYRYNRTYSGRSFGWVSNSYYYSGYDPFTFMLDRSGNLVIVMFESSSLSYYPPHVGGVCLPSTYVESLLSTSDLSIDRAPSMSYIPEGIEAEQGIALDVGAAATMDLDLVLQGVLDDVIAGELTSTMEAAGEEVVDPPADEITDVDNLGLPALGQALTSRFPFSIPWDFFRAVQLLAAPAKAPHFEVDFMEPLADDVGGWQGDTTVVLDFSEYAIIGQISRWTSTIGFCLVLAGATKRLIWTA